MLRGSQTDLTLRNAYASYLYQIGDVVAANRVTTRIMKEAGIYQVRTFEVRFFVVGIVWLEKLGDEELVRDVGF